MFYQLGEKALKVSMKLFALNRKNLVQRLRKVPDLPKSSLVLLQGGFSTNRHCTDHEDIFRQVKSIFNSKLKYCKRLNSSPPFFHSCTSLMYEKVRSSIQPFTVCQR